MCLLLVDGSEDLCKGTSRQKKAHKLRPNEAVGKILKDFIEAARPILEHAYYKDSKASSSGIEGLTQGQTSSLAT